LEKIFHIGSADQRNVCAKRDIAHTSLEAFLQFLTLLSPSGDIDFEFSETF